MGWDGEGRAPSTLNVLPDWAALNSPLMKKTFCLSRDGSLSCEEVSSRHQINDKHLQIQNRNCTYLWRHGRGSSCKNQ